MSRFPHTPGGDHGLHADACMWGWAGAIGGHVMPRLDAATQLVVATVLGSHASR